MERSSTAIKVFAGNLSFFSGREELEKLFSPCGTIENIHLCKSESGDTMHFAFITFTNQDEASTAINTLNNTLFMGRNICVRTADRTIAKQFASTRKLEGWEVMFSFISHQKDVLVCEESLRGIFMKFGEVLDCVIRSYNKGDNANQANRGLQNGYGFVEFRDRDTAEYVVTNIKSGSFLPLSSQNKVGTEKEDSDSGLFTVNLDCSFSRRSVSRLEEIKTQDCNNFSPTMKVKSHSTEISARQVDIPFDSSKSATQENSSVQLLQGVNSITHSIGHTVPSFPAQTIHVQAPQSFHGNNHNISFGPNSAFVITPTSYSIPFMQHNLPFHQSSQSQIQMSPYAIPTQSPLLYSRNNAATASDISHSNSHVTHVYSTGPGNESNFVTPNNSTNNMIIPSSAPQDTAAVPMYVYPSQQPSVAFPMPAGQTLSDNTARLEANTSFATDGGSYSTTAIQLSPHPSVFYPPQVSSGYYSPPYFYTQQASTQYAPQQHQHQPIPHVNVPSSQQSMTMVVQPHASVNTQYYSMPVDYHQSHFLAVPHQQNHHIAPQHNRQSQLQSQQHPSPQHSASPQHNRQSQSQSQQHPSPQHSASTQHHGEFYRRPSNQSQSPRSSRSQSHSLSQHGTFFRG